MEGDNDSFFLRVRIDISIHSLRMEGDPRSQGLRLMSDHFNPLPPHGGRHPETFTTFPIMGISIPSLRMEGDPSELGTNIKPVISIHSLRMEGDPAPAVGW